MCRRTRVPEEVRVEYQLAMADLHWKVKEATMVSERAYWQSPRVCVRRARLFSPVFAGGDQRRGSNLRSDPRPPSLLRGLPPKKKRTMHAVGWHPVVVPRAVSSPSTGTLPSSRWTVNRRCSGTCCPTCLGVWVWFPFWAPTSSPPFSPRASILGSAISPPGRGADERPHPPPTEFLTRGFRDLVLPFARE